MSKTLEKGSPELAARMMFKKGYWSWPGALWRVMPKDGLWRSKTEMRDQVLALKAQHDRVIEVTSGTVIRTKRKFDEHLRLLKIDGWVEARGTDTATQIRWRDVARPYTEVGEEPALLSALATAEQFIAVDHDGMDSACAGCRVLRAVRRALGVYQPEREEQL